jgi:hypothetical protein
MQWRPFLPKEGGLIQVDIGDHPPFPTGSKQFSVNFGNLLFLAVFNLWGHFEALNDVFGENRFAIYNFLHYFPQNESPQRYPHDFWHLIS